MGSSAPGQVDIPPQPGSSVQETSFAADTANLTVLPHSPMPENGQSSGYGTGTSTPRLPSPQPSRSRLKPPPPARVLAPDLLRGLLMVLMAADHNAMGLHAWPHGTAVDGETPSVPVTAWNSTLAIWIRMLSHLCAPGFTFLLGMGVVYFGRSRSNLGWTSAQMARHFLVRAVVLTLVTVTMGLVLTAGKTWFLNVVLFALAVDYLIAGLVWMGISGLEKRVAFALFKTGAIPQRREDDPSEPLLGRRREDIAPDRTIMRAADVAWHANNAVLVVLAVVTIWWNIWLSPASGRCDVSPEWAPPASLWFRIWFYPVETKHILSGFPPLGWLSFAFLGLLYGRIVLARTWSPRTVNLANAATGVIFFLIFILTRLAHVGNLSEGCLQMPEHVAHPDKNQYLTSPAAFFYLIKYPPDVAFWSFSMAGNFFLLSIFGSIPTRLATRALHVLLVFGTSALFFYVTHIVVMFSLGGLWVKLFGHELPTKDPWTGGPGVGLDQPWVFFANWALGLAILYPVCRWYGHFKKTKGPDSLWRFF